MTKEYTYLPPVKYLAQIIIGFAGFCFLIFCVVKIEDAIWLRVFLSIFSLLFFVHGFLFYKRCFSRIKGFKIKISKNKVTMPFVENGINLFFNLLEVENIDVYQNFDTEIIEFKSKKGYLVVEKSWMKNRDYAEFLNILKNNNIQF